MSYVDNVIEQVKEKNPNEPEFIQAVTEVLTSLKPVIESNPAYEKAGLLERIVEPERVVMFRVPWVDDAGNVHFTCTRATACSSTAASGPTRAACACIRR